MIWGDAVRITVFNSGKPIPGHDLEKIWTSFDKADKARTRALGGHRLGLIHRPGHQMHGSGYGVANLPDGAASWFDAAKTPAG